MAPKTPQSQQQRQHRKRPGTSPRKLEKWYAEHRKRRKLMIPATRAVRAGEWFLRRSVATSQKRASCHYLIKRPHKDTLKKRSKSAFSLHRHVPDTTSALTRYAFAIRPTWRIIERLLSSIDYAALLLSKRLLNMQLTVLEYAAAQLKPVLQNTITLGSQLRELQEAEKADIESYRERKRRGHRFNKPVRPILKDKQISAGAAVWPGPQPTLTREQILMQNRQDILDGKLDILGQQGKDFRTRSRAARTVAHPADQTFAQAPFAWFEEELDKSPQTNIKQQQTLLAEPKNPYPVPPLTPARLQTLQRQAARIRDHVDQHLQCGEWEDPEYTAELYEKIRHYAVAIARLYYGNVKEGIICRLHTHKGDVTQPVGEALSTSRILAILEKNMFTASLLSRSSEVWKELKDEEEVVRRDWKYSPGELERRLLDLRRRYVQAARQAPDRAQTRKHKEDRLVAVLLKDMSDHEQQLVKVSPGLRGSLKKNLKILAGLAHDCSVLAGTSRYFWLFVRFDYLYSTPWEFVDVLGTVEGRILAGGVGGCNIALTVSPALFTREIGGPKVRTLRAKSWVVVERIFDVSDVTYDAEKIK